MMIIMLMTVVVVVMMMKVAFEEKRIESSKFKSGETGKEGRKQKHEF